MAPEPPSAAPVINVRRPMVATHLRPVVNACARLVFFAPHPQESVKQMCSDRRFDHHQRRLRACLPVGHRHDVGQTPHQDIRQTVARLLTFSGRGAFELGAALGDVLEAGVVGHDRVVAQMRH